ncbi:hypothetical protein THRCLA_05892 [Thraustotheca clavata]|uniref:WD domain-containing protein n=1 Tax=Thraustotheca clavata TaxID=74557 RepID=A0A1V9ZRU2_9STRA|nr:hypothetical protein THRCLA_05892 [Thraustotheca clavata]
MNNRFGSNRGRGNRGGRGGRGSGNRFTQSEICTFYLDLRCTHDNCRHPHFIKKLGMATGHTQTIKDVVVWEANQQAFTCSVDGTLRLWDLGTMKEIANIPQCNTELDSLPVQKEKQSSEGVASMHLEGMHLFVGFEEPTAAIPDVPVGRIQCWNLENPAAPPMEFMVSPEMPFAHYRNVWALAVAKDPTTGAIIIFSGSGDGRIRYWMYDAATQAFKCGGVMEGHSRGITRLKTVQLGAAMALISSSMDHTIRIWDLTTFKCATVLSRANDGHANVVMDIEVWVNNGEQFLISGGLDQQVIVWRLQPPFQQVFRETIDQTILSLCTTTDANEVSVLLLGHEDGSITVKELPSFQYKCCFGKNISNVGHYDAVRRIVKGPMHTFFTVSNDKKMMAWQITGKASDISNQN